MRIFLCLALAVPFLVGCGKPTKKIEGYLTSVDKHEDGRYKIHYRIPTEKPFWWKEEGRFDNGSSTHVQMNDDVAKGLQMPNYYIFYVDDENRVYDVRKPIRINKMIRDKEPEWVARQNRQNKRNAPLSPIPVRRH